jgi:BlaI family transcriptional regulator, penicillinase repressor
LVTIRDIRKRSYLTQKGTSPRRSLLDLAPLELACMNTLWPMGQGTVRAIRDRLAECRPRAYTTIMTIMDRLARKGIVDRRKVGRAYIYRPNLPLEEARAQAVSQIVEGYFGGSKEALLRQLASSEFDARVRAAAASAKVSPPDGMPGFLLDGPAEPGIVSRRPASASEKSTGLPSKVDKAL